MKKKHHQQNSVTNSPSWWSRLPEWLRVGALLLLLLVAGWLTVAKKLLMPLNPVPMETPAANPKTSQRKMNVGTAELQVEVRKTAAEQALGLSWRTQLGQDEGMVFVYAAPQKVMYWMRGMQFPLDFLWVRQGKVVEVTERVAAPTKTQPVPRTLVPNTAADMVVEVNAGWIETHGVKIGDLVTIAY